MRRYDLTQNAVNEILKPTTREFRNAVASYDSTLEQVRSAIEQIIHFRTLAATSSPKSLPCGDVCEPSIDCLVCDKLIDKLKLERQ